VQVLQMMTIFENSTRWCRSVFYSLFCGGGLSAAASMWEEEEEGREQGAGSMQG
jgi:hypothetical protein